MSTILITSQHLEAASNNKQIILVCGEGSAFHTFANGGTRYEREESCNKVTLSIQGLHHSSKSELLQKNIP